jgi:hypothetical protein
MFAPLLIFWIVWVATMAANTQRQTRRRRQMGPRIHITEPEFLDLADKERGLIIRAPQPWKATLYLLRSGDYYYYTITKTPLELPGDCQVVESKQILL